MICANALGSVHVKLAPGWPQSNRRLCIAFDVNRSSAIDTRPPGPAAKVAGMSALEKVTGGNGGTMASNGGGDFAARLPMRLRDRQPETRQTRWAGLKFS